MKGKRQRREWARPTTTCPAQSFPQFHAHFQQQKMSLSLPPSPFHSALHFGGPIPADPDPSTADNNRIEGQFPPHANFIQTQISVELANKELWEKFDKVGNEMVVTRPGRKMFPKLELHLQGLDPKGQYTVFMSMEKMGSIRYKYQAGGWSAAGQDDKGPDQTNHVIHHEGWNDGEYWASQEKVTFEMVKLTNKEVPQGGGKSLISLCSMQKYRPVISLCQYIQANGGYSIVREFRPMECKFIAVTAYQSEALTNLKIEHNPYAKGFREGSSRKRSAAALSPLPTAAEGGIAPPLASPSTLLFSSISPPSNCCPAAKRPLLLGQSPPSIGHFPFQSSAPFGHSPTIYPSVAQFAAVAMLANQNQQKIPPNQQWPPQNWPNWQWPLNAQLSHFDAASVSSFYQNLWQQIWMGQQKKAGEGEIVNGGKMKEEGNKEKKEKNEK